jgi:hypothetical protein
VTGATRRQWRRRGAAAPGRATGVVSWPEGWAGRVRCYRLHSRVKPKLAGETAPAQLAICMRAPNHLSNGTHTTRMYDTRHDTTRHTNRRGQNTVAIADSEMTAFPGCLRVEAHSQAVAALQALLRTECSRRGDSPASRPPFRPTTSPSARGRPGWRPKAEVSGKGTNHRAHARTHARTHTHTHTQPPAHGQKIVPQHVEDFVDVE